MKTISILLVMTMAITHLKAQNVGIGTNTPQASAALDISATNKGFLLPRLTEAQRLAIANPAKGLLVYQTDGNIGLQHFDGTAWKSLQANGSFVDLTSDQSIAGNKVFTKDLFINQIRLGNGANGITSSLAFGPGNLGFNQGINNVAIGHRAMSYNEAGNNNSALGFFAMYFNTVGVNNVAVGSNSLRDNTNGSQNTVVGTDAMRKNLSGYGNQAFGYTALYDNISGNSNVAIGFSSLGNNIGGNGNTAVGNNAISQLEWGKNNTAIGYYADIVLTDAQNATAIGASAEANCSHCLILGAQKDVNYNRPSVSVGIGVKKPLSMLHVDPDGSGGILVGTDKFEGGYTTIQMGISAKSGGYGFLQSVSASGSAYGTLALNPESGKVGIRTGNAIGDLHVKQSVETTPVATGGLALERRNTTDRWNLATDQNNYLSFAFNGSAKSYINPSNGSYVTLSDMRIKKDIQPLEPVLAKVMQLQPKTYHYQDNKTTAPLSYGLIAQELEALFPDMVSTDEASGIKAVGYDHLIVVALKAIQELKGEIEVLKIENKKILESCSGK